MTADRRVPARVGLLALLYGTGGLFCVAGALRPMHPETPVALTGVLAAVGIGGAAALLARGDRLSQAGGHTALAGVSLLVALLASRSVTAVGIVGLGPVLIAIGLYAAHFCSLPAARAHAGLAVGAASLGAAVALPSAAALPWLMTAVSALLLTEAHARLNSALRTAAATDPLTGLPNRRSWEAEAGRSLARALRSDEPLTVAVLDLDDFKAVNDRDGHGSGDRLLQQVADHWQSRLRTADLLGRYGGDEFVLCLPATDGPGARELITRLDGGPIGWSVGTATARAGDSLATLLQRADAELYAGKRLRRLVARRDGDG
ncbi:MULTISPECIES: GGDEF domain-containing protein [unclassified Modestobacter]|uniref:GGDEF domain-containing protein n=1 Tax=unclassified Modestobacter TaxID=2643866 RepID=UPI0022AA5669|nr:MULTISPECIES: GGDEF domain-containing protein [unclassified Modestobacter]MCZ2826764.1 GGDEF domain-containing protein [Modestobacter sp. VKM Ac-2981]MCZ2855144.1 GGDEF domain-containing protein [Modestobacter sp. VKM Ac-2982]